MILQAADVQSLSVRQYEVAHEEHIEVTGLAFHSSLAVTSATGRLEGNALRIIVHLGPAAPGRSGNFKYDAPLPSVVQTIRFGDKGEIIWERKPAKQP